MANKNTIQDWRFTPIKSRRKFRNDLAGTQIEKLWVIGLAGRHARLMYWLCECECGEFIFVSTGQLTRTDERRTRSCGCANKQPKSHGLSKTRAYKIWCLMKDRCLNPRNKSYASYGGAGVSVCDRWLKFENFLADMGHPPSRRHSIDRYPNKEGNYKPDNCRWATPSEQARNRNSNKLLTFNDKTLCLAEWAELTEINQNTLGMRLLSGWSVERALTTPLRNR